MAGDWTVDRTVPPTDRPVTLEQAKLSLRLSPTDSPLDPEILDLIDAATSRWEQDTDMPAIAQTFVQSRYCFPAEINLTKRPVQSIESISYTDVDGVDQTIDGAEYGLRKGDQLVYSKSDDGWPAVKPSPEAVRITYVAGYTSAATVPRDLKRAVILAVGALFYIDAGGEQYDAAYQALVQQSLHAFHAS